MKFTTLYKKAKTGKIMRGPFWRSSKNAKTLKLKLLFFLLGFANIIDGLFLIFTFGYFHTCRSEYILDQIIRRRSNV